MATVMRFPSNYPVYQWEIRLKIEGLLNKLGWDIARCMMWFSADTADKWLLLDDEYLLMMVDCLEEEYMLAQCAPKRPAAMPHAEVTTAPQKDRLPARRIAFPVSPEMAARQKSAKAAKPQRTTTSKTPRQTAQPDDKELAAKANYIRRIKMLQRDCEKALHRFDDDAYRAILAEQFHATTSKALNLPQLRALLMYMKGLLQESRTPIKASFDAPALLHHDANGLSRCGSMRKIQALLAEKGKAEGKYIRWSYALGILKRQTKGVTADWEDATPRQLDAVIAALSKDAQRKRRRTQ